MTLPDAVRLLMAEQGITTSDLTRLMKPQVDPMTVYRMVNGTLGEPRVGTTIAFANALGVSPDELLTLAGLWVPPDAVTPGDDAGSQKVRQRLAALPPDRQLLAIRMMLLVLPEIETAELGTPAAGHGPDARPGDQKWGE